MGCPVDIMLPSLNLRRREFNLNVQLCYHQQNAVRQYFNESLVSVFEQYCTGI